MGRPSALFSKARRRAGQAAVFVAMILFTLVIFLALATNIGIIVNDKIRMQNTADLATYAAAYSEAQVLNELVYLNTQIADTIANCRSILVSSSPYVDCLCQYKSPVAEAVLDGCEQAINGQIGRFVIAATYNKSVTEPLKAGYATAEANFSGIRGQTSFMENVPDSPTFPNTYELQYQTNPRSGSPTRVPSIANYSQATGINAIYAHLTFCPGPNCSCCIPYLYYPGAGDDRPTWAGWFYKTTSDPEIWVEGRVYGTPKKQFLDISYSGGYFGASGGGSGGNDMLYAYAVAKPYEGSVGPTRKSSDIDAPWQIGELFFPGPGGSMMLDAERDLAMVEEYRARLAGMNEALAGPTDPLEVARQDGTLNLSKTWNTAYFHH